MTDLRTQATALYTDAGSGALKTRHYVLEVIAGPDVGARATVREGTMIVGTSAEADLRLADPTVSRHHLELQLRASGVRVSDPGSRNGTFQGPTRIGTVIVTAATTLRLGRSTEITIAPVDEEVRIGPYEGERFGEALGASAPMRQLFALLAKVAPTETTVLLEGETGTGKELLAEGLHRLSARARGHFVVLDCAALARELIGSELFGHTRGAYTGATEAKAGLAEEADGGTLFLDEIGEMPLELQPQLLRLIEKRELRRLGESRTRRVSVRFVAATNRDLKEEVKRGTFREDLYFRLAVVRARVPPLRERPDDIPLLVRSFLADAGQGDFTPPDAVLDALRQHAWPGNVRELRNVVERGLRLDETLGEEPVTPAIGNILQDVRTPPIGMEAAGPSAQPGPPAAIAEAGAGVLDLPFKEAKNRLVEAFEREYLVHLLERHQGNISRAAQEAGIDRNYIHRLVKKYGIAVSRG